jgi:hypothetical protein
MTPFRTVLDGEDRRLELDGTDIARQVTGFTLTGHGRHTPTLTLDLFPGDLDVNHPDVNVKIDDNTRALLVRLGWTPPEPAETGRT